MGQPSNQLPTGYRLRRGSRADRPQLLAGLAATYRELMPLSPDPTAIALLVDRLWTADGQLWWVEAATAQASDGQSNGQSWVAGLWLGWAIDPETGQRRAQLLWLYVQPAERRRGLARALLHQAEQQAKQAGCDRLGLQVGASNQAAIALYQSLGYQTRSLELVKSWDGAAVRDADAPATPG